MAINIRKIKRKRKVRRKKPVKTPSIPKKMPDAFIINEISKINPVPTRRVLTIHSKFETI